MKKLPLSNGGFTLVDDVIFSVFKGIVVWSHKGYAELRIPGVNFKVPLHRVIMLAPKGSCVDHINGDKLDNRFENLRLCTREQNNYNYPRQKNNTTGYKGVHFHKKNKRFMARVGRGGYLGCFSTAEEAAKAYNKAAISRFGEFARLNAVGEV